MNRQHPKPAAPHSTDPQRQSLLPLLPFVACRLPLAVGRWYIASLPNHLPLRLPLCEPKKKNHRFVNVFYFFCELNHAGYGQLRMAHGHFTWPWGVLYTHKPNPQTAIVHCAMLDEFHCGILHSGLYFWLIPICIFSFQYKHKKQGTSLMYTHTHRHTDSSNFSISTRNKEPRSCTHTHTHAHIHRHTGTQTPTHAHRHTGT